MSTAQPASPTAPAPPVEPGPQTRQRPGGGLARTVRPAPRWGQLRGAAAGWAASGALAVGVGLLWRGTTGAAAAAVAAAAVAAAYLVSTAVVVLADAHAPRLLLPLGLGCYTVTVTALGLAAFRLARGAGSWHPVVAVAVPLTVGGWVAGAAWTWWRTPVLYVDPAAARPHRRPGPAPSLEPPRRRRPGDR